MYVIACAGSFGPGAAQVRACASPYATGAAYVIACAGSYATAAYVIACGPAYATGAAYVGAFESDEKHGVGSYTFEDGSVFRGEFVDEPFELAGERRMVGGGDAVGAMHLTIVTGRREPV